MKIEVISELIEQPDGSGIVEIDFDEEGKTYLLQLGFETLLKRAIEVMKKEDQLKPTPPMQLELNFEEVKDLEWDKK